VALTQDPVVLASAWDHSLHGVDARTGAERFFFFTGSPLWDVGGLDASTWSSPVVATINGVAVAFSGSYDGKLRSMPLETLMGRRSDRPSAIGFWVSLPLTVLPLMGLALWLTRRHRRARAPNATG